MKLVYRISIAILLIVFFTTVILAGYSFYVQKSLINNQLVKKGQVLARLLSASITNHLISYDYYAINLLIDPLRQDSDIFSVAIIGTDNYIKMHSDLSKIGDKSFYKYSDNDFSDNDILTFNNLVGQHRQYQFFTPAKIDQSVVGMIHIILTDRESLVLIHKFAKKMVLITSVVLLGAIFAGYLMSRQISKPLIELSEEIDRFMMKRISNKTGFGSRNEITVLKNNFKKMMAELQQSIESRVKNEKMAVLGNLSSVLAHEVKNPLEPIKGSAEILKCRYPDNRDIIKYTEIIQAEVSELIGFLDSFLDVAKLSNVDMKSLDINKTINDILLLLEYTFAKECIDVDVKLDEYLPPVNGNAGMIKQVFLNLLINAVQAKNGEYGLIEIRTSKDDEYVTITFKDYGIGIEKSRIEFIFQSFYTTKGGGSGIGLSTSRHLIEKHNGTISISSEYGSWTEVSVRLPSLKEYD